MSERPFVQRHSGKIGGGLAAAIAVAVPVIMAWEGTEYVGYRDVVSVATSCTGHTGPDAIVGRRYTPEECRNQLARDLQRTAEGIAPCIKADVPRESLAAFVSLSFNIGPAAFCKASLTRKLNAGDLAGACAGMDAWVYAGGRKIKGLVNRRKAERELCEKGLRS